MSQKVMKTEGTMQGINQITLIKTEQVSRTYEAGGIEVVALESASCEIKTGDRIALVGQSGSGKSTLLQVLGKLEKPSKGHVDFSYFENHNIHPIRPMGISYIFQMPSLIPSLSVIENVALPLLIMNQPKAITENLALNELRKLEIDHLKDKLPEELSGGQAQRVAAARALVCKPKVILADEPSGQLDHHTARHLMKVLLETSEEEGMALVIATHDNEVVKQLDQVWTIKQGRLEVTSQ